MAWTAPPLMQNGFRCNTLFTCLQTSGAVPVRAASRELQHLLSVLPDKFGSRLKGHTDVSQLLEIVLDLGRRPMARLPSGDWPISQDLVTLADLEDAICMVGDFADDNRAGIDRTLHRISAIRNRGGKIVGLTCRVGRAISGSAEMVRDMVSGGASLLFMGPPGVGKTTAIREVARMLADDYDKRVIVVDTSNEIAGDGDIPHPGIGRARRMQVPNVDLQHKVMIEAVENHMPETIVIDEIGTELEALAAVTISQRGVQLVATAHGMSVQNLIKNPALEILAGGIQCVTLGDDEARRRGVQKTVLERKGPPTFTAAVEMVSQTEWRIHHNLTATVDALLGGQPPLFDVRKMSEGEVTVADNSYPECGNSDNEDELPPVTTKDVWQRHDPFSVYLYQVSEELLKQAIAVLELQELVFISNDIGTSDAVLTLRSKLKQNMWVRNMAKFRQLPIFTIQDNSLPQMLRAARTIVDVVRPVNTTVQKAPRTNPEDELDALEEARMAIEQIVIPKRQGVELIPRSAQIMALQMKLADSYQVSSQVTNSRLRILPEIRTVNNNSNKSGSDDATCDPTARLPILPE